MRRNVFEMIVSAFLIGVFLRSFFELSFYTILFLFFLACVFLAYGFFSKQGRERRLFFLIPLFFLCALLGAIRYELSEPHSSVLGQFIGETVILEGTISGEPDRRDTNTVLAVRVDVVQVNQQLLKTRELIRISAPIYPEFLYGDRIRVRGVVEKPENFETDSGRIFDYQSYLAKEGVYYQISRPVITFIEHGQGNPIASYLFQFKHALLASSARVIPDPEHGLLAGLLFGEKHSIGDDFSELFRKSGLVHIVVLSGFNLTIVAYALMYLFSFLPRTLSVGAGGLGILAFTIMTGASATAVRAALMAGIALLAKVTARAYRIKRALFLAALRMIFYNPKLLVFDPSFQLSFLATIGLVYFSPFVEKKICFVPERFGLREIVAATLSTQLFVLPLLINLSGTVSLIGIFANIAVLPMIPITMFFGALASFAGLLHTVLATPFGYAAYFLLHYEILAAEFFGNLPLAAVSVPSLPTWVIVLSYLALGAFIYRLYRKKEGRSTLPLPARNFSQSHSN